MAIDPTMRVGTAFPLSIERLPGRTGQNEGASARNASFGELVQDALEQLNRLQQEADDAATRLAIGEPVDLHDVMIAVQKADLGFQLALQVRNKLIEAYQEIMRMQV